MSEPAAKRSKSVKPPPSPSPDPPVDAAQPRSRPNKQLSQYLTTVTTLFTPSISLQPYSYGGPGTAVPIERPSLLGVLQSPLRRPTVLENWSPREILTFEASMAVYGKNFHKIGKSVRTKTCKDVIEFYYIWKKSENYKAWKRNYECELHAETDIETAGGIVKAEQSN